MPAQQILLMGAKKRVQLTYLQVPANTLVRYRVIGLTAGLVTAGTVAYDYDSFNDNLHETWLLSGTVADYEVRWTNVTGSAAGSPTGSWLSVNGADQSWEVSNGTITGTVEIRDKNTLAVLATATADLHGDGSI